MPDFSDTERRLIDLLKVGVKFQLKCFVNSNLSSIFAPKLKQQTYGTYKRNDSNQELFCQDGGMGKEAEGPSS